MEVTMAFLRNKLSPMQDPAFTGMLKEMLVGADLTQFKRELRKGEYIVLYPSELWKVLFDTVPTVHDLINLGRSLQALYWERSALVGALVFLKKVDEYESFGY